MVERIRLITQHVSFLFFIYGGRLGIQLGHSLPCFSCPYASGCAGHCYLMALQSSHAGFQVSFDYLFSRFGLQVLWAFAAFLLFFIPLSKFWCAWLCPFCLFQDWLTMIRKKMGIREMIISPKVRDNIRPVKFILLGLMVIIPLAVANFGLHPDWALPFCQICPAKPILPIFTGNFSYFSIDFTNSVTLVFSLVSMVITGGFLVGMFFKERFFCMVCPMLGLMHIFKAISPLKFEKNVDTCLACGNCQRICPIDISRVHLEKKKKDVLTQDCMACMRCVESCPGDRVLTFKWFKFDLFSSSRLYLARKWSKKK